MKKKVMHIISDLSTAGAQTVVMNYLREMRDDEEFEVIAVVVEERKPGKYNIEVKNECLPVIYCGYKETGFIRPIGSIINWFTYQKLVYREIKRYNPDIIHTHITGLLPYVSIPIILSGVKRVHTLHSDPRAVSPLYVKWAKILFHKFSFQPICVTDDQCEIAKKIYELSDCPIVHNGIKLDVNPYKVPKNEARSLLNIPLAAYVIGFAGRLHEIKNIDFLIDVFYEYANQNEKAILVLAGDGPEKGHLISKVKNLGLMSKILFLGVVDNMDLLYASLDLFMITSFFESSSIVTVEAQLHGVRCVVSTGIPEQVVITDRVNRLSLDAPKNQWVDAVLDKLPKEAKIYDVDDLVLEKSIADTKRIYRGL